ncbi:hypothetical protein HDU93_007189, partial [Gonapodya sp. JEL0774]
MSYGNPSTLLHVLVVGIHPKRGSVVELAFPSLPPVGALDDVPPQYNGGYGRTPSPNLFDSHSKIDGLTLPPSWQDLPHFAIPDGLRARDDQLVAFNLPPVLERDCVGPNEDETDHFSTARSAESDRWRVNPVQRWYDLGYHLQTTFAISSVFYTESPDDRSPSDQPNLRSFNIKAVVIIMRLPGFGAVSARLRVAARALAVSSPEERGPILRDLYRGASNTFESVLAKRGAYALDDDDLTGVHLVDLVRRYKHHTLTLLKLLLLQRKVAFVSRYGNTEQICEDLYALVSAAP